MSIKQLLVFPRKPLLHASATVSAKSLRWAVYSFESILGRDAVECMIVDLEAQGLQLTSSIEKYTFAQFETALENIYGIEGTRFLLREVSKTFSEKLR